MCVLVCVAQGPYAAPILSESAHAVSHAVVLPQDPRALAAATPAPVESAGDDWTIAFGGGTETGDVGELMSMLLLPHILLHHILLPHILLHHILLPLYLCRRVWCGHSRWHRDGPHTSGHAGRDHARG